MPRHPMSLLFLLMLTLATAPTAGALQGPDGKLVGCADFGRLQATELEKVTAADLDRLLLDAAAAGCPGVIEAAVAQGAAVDARDGSGNTALLVALTMNRKEAAKSLLNAGADPNVANSRGLMPLSAAVYKGSDELVRLLLHAGARNDILDEVCQGVRGPMVFAAQHGESAIVASLLDSGLDVNARYKHGMTALMFTAGNGNEVSAAKSIETARLLLERGADVEAVDARGRSALMIAAGRNNAGIVSMLLQRGAGPLRLDLFGNTALELTDDDRVLEELGLAMKGVAPLFNQ